MDGATEAQLADQEGKSGTAFEQIRREMEFGVGTILCTEELQNGGNMAPPRAFISFEMEDKWARDFLVQHAKDKKNDIEFHDYSVKDPFDSKWKTECVKRIALTKGTIVLVGPTTSMSDAVVWEIAETIRQGHYLFGIQVNRDVTHPIPRGLPSKNVIRWDFAQVVDWLKTWE